MIDGSTIYGIDVSLEGMLVGAVKANPVFGGHLNGVDLAPLQMKPGIQLVTKYDHDHFRSYHDGPLIAPCSPIIRPSSESLTPHVPSHFR